MNQAKEVCVDASLAVKVVLKEADSDKADALFDEWVRAEVRLIAPTFFEVETNSILRQKVVVRKELTPEQAEAVFAALQSLPIQQLFVPGQRQRAWEVAAQFGFAAVYDATYLALAELRGVEFWTADEKLFDQVKDRLTCVKWLGDYIPKAKP